MNQDIEIRRQLVATIEGLTARNTQLESSLEHQTKELNKLQNTMQETDKILSLVIFNSTGLIRQRLKEVKTVLNVEA